MDVPILERVERLAVHDHGGVHPASTCRELPEVL
jgi:hypothetical protein